LPFKARDLQSSSQTGRFDDYGHGIAVAGVVAAAIHNRIGVVGVSWNNPNMPLVVIDSTGSGAYSNVVSAIQYAADHGARIIKLSLGGPHGPKVR
jgi:subtilisin family serine protease